MDGNVGQHGKVSIATNKKQQMSLLQQYCTSLKMPLPTVHFDRCNPMGAANHPTMLQSFEDAIHQL
jgi:hypothetical protein